MNLFLTEIQIYVNKIQAQVIICQCQDKLIEFKLPKDVDLLAERKDQSQHIPKSLTVPNLVIIEDLKHHKFRSKDLDQWLVCLKKVAEEEKERVRRRSKTFKKLLMKEVLLFLKMFLLIFMLLKCLLIKILWMNLK